MHFTHVSANFSKPVGDLVTADNLAISSDRRGGQRYGHPPLAYLVIADHIVDQAVVCIGAGFAITAMTSPTTSQTRRWSALGSAWGSAFVIPAMKLNGFVS